MDGTAWAVSCALAFCWILFWTISDVFFKADLSADPGDDTSSFPID